MSKFVQYFFNEIAAKQYYLVEAKSTRNYKKLHIVHGNGKEFEDWWSSYLVDNPDGDFVVEEGKVYRKMYYQIYPNAFNGSNFDHYEFFKEAIALGYNFDEFVIQNGSIIRARVKNVNLIDLRKYTVGSLLRNLKDWKC